jgi:hypothetical protein
MQFTTKKACQLLNRDRKTQADDIATGYCGHVPEAVANFRFWNSDDLAAELFFMQQRADGHSVKMAGAVASRLRRAMSADPEANQLTLVTLENGNRFAVATDKLDVSSGFNSGCAIREATMVDVRNLRARIGQLIDADAELIGDRDDD